MMRQYNAQRGHAVTYARGLVGSVRAGDYVFVQVGSRDMQKHNRARVLGWLNREYTAHHKDAHGQWQSVYMLGGHLSVVQMLHNGEVCTLAEQWLIPQ